MDRSADGQLLEKIGRSSDGQVRKLCSESHALNNLLFVAAANSRSDRGLDEAVGFSAKTKERQVALPCGYQPRRSGGGTVGVALSHDGRKVQQVALLSH